MNYNAYRIIILKAAKKKTDKEQALENMKENTEQMEKDPDFPKDKKSKKDKGYPSWWGGGAK